MKPRLTRLALWMAAVVAIGTVSCRAADAGAPDGDSAGPAAGIPCAEKVATDDAKETKIDPDVDRVLRLAEEAGKKIAKLDTRFDYEFRQTLIDENEWRLGRMIYRKPSDIRIEFTDGKKEVFRFNGRVYVEDRPGQRQRYVHIFRKPHQKPISILDVEELPFPHPFGQKRDTLLKDFEIRYKGKVELEPWARPGVKADADAPDNPKKYEHLELLPKPKSRAAKEYVRIDYWLDPDNGLFRQVRTEDKSERILTVRFRDIKINDKVKTDERLFEEGSLPDKTWERVENDHTTEEPQGEKAR